MDEENDYVIFIRMAQKNQGSPPPHSSPPPHKKTVLFGERRTRHRKRGEENKLRKPEYAGTTLVPF